MINDVKLYYDFHRKPYLAYELNVELKYQFMTISDQPKSLYVLNYQYAYQQNFEVALLNLEEVIREERIQKRMRKHKDKQHRHN